jgi:NTE family protein
MAPNGQSKWLQCEEASPVGLVFSGGGARGAFQVGAWKALLEDGRGLCRPPEVVSGTSCGAINGALIAAGLGPDEMLGFWLGLADDPPVVANERFFAALLKATAAYLVQSISDDREARARQRRIFASLLRRHRLWSLSGWDALLSAYALTARFDAVSTILRQIPTPFVFDATAVKEHLRRALRGTELRSTSVALAINAVDVRTGRVVRFVNRKPEKGPRASTTHYRYEPAIDLDMIMASAAIPLLFNPFRVRDLELWDGGLLVNSPMAPAVALGARRIIPVLVTTARPVAEEARIPSFGWAVERLVDTFLDNAYQGDRKLLLDRNELAHRLPEENLTVVELARPIRPLPGTLFDVGSYLFFERRAMLAMYAAGQEAARRWLDRGPEMDSRKHTEEP